MATIDVLDIQGKKTGSRDLRGRGLRGARERAADAPGGRRGPRRRSAPARIRRRPAATSGEAARSRGARRAPAGPGRARSARRSGRAAGSRTGRIPAITRCGSTRRCGRARCARRSPTPTASGKLARRLRHRLRRAQDQAGRRAARRARASPARCWSCSTGRPTTAPSRSRSATCPTCGCATRAVSAPTTCCWPTAWCSRPPPSTRSKVATVPGPGRAGLGGGPRGDRGGG